MSDTRNKIIVGAVVAVVVIFVVVLIATRSQASCELSETKPVLGVANAIKKASSDNKALANFTGFLQYYNTDKKIYLPLELESVSLSGTNELVLDTNCAKITFTLKTTVANQSTQSVEKITLDLITPGDNDIKTCTITDSSSIKNDISKHYACAKQIKYACSSSNAGKTTNVADLYVNVLEFETVGDHTNGTFTTPPVYC